MGCKTNACCNMAYTTSAKGVVVWDSNGCAKKLYKPTYASVFGFDGQSTTGWQDGSEDNPICLPNIQEGIGYLTTFLVGMTPQGCLFKIPVTSAEIDVCQDGISTTLTILTVENAP